MEENIHTTKMLDLIVSEDYADIFIVMNYVQNDLKHILRYTKEGLGEDVIIIILFKLLCALNFIHKANVMHRDLKPGNVLIDENLTL